MANFVTPHPMTMRRCRAHDILPHRIEFRLAKPLHQLLAQSPPEKHRLKTRGIDETLPLHHGLLVRNLFHTTQ